jgi:hypothetical protein
LEKKYDLDELLKNPNKPLTKSQYENFHKYMRPVNNDKSAKDVDLSKGAEKIIRRIKRNGTYWW